MNKLFLLVLSVSFLSGCAEIVDTGHRGIKTNYGKVVSESLEEGFYFYNPFSSSIVEMDVRLRRMEKKANTYTKDVQQANITYVANYYLQKDRVHIMYQDVGVRWEEVLIPQAVEGALKAVIGKWDAVDLIGNRDKATREAESAVQAVLKDKGVVLSRLELVNIDYLPEFEKAVEAKVVAIQRAAESVNRTKQVEEEAKQKVVAAKAEAESMRIRANALTQNKALVEYEAVQKWDGHMPQYMLGGGAMPFINLNK